jgi:hypothetical protein
LAGRHLQRRVWVLGAGSAAVPQFEVGELAAGPAGAPPADDPSTASSS